MIASIIICTQNRAESLQRTLESIGKVEIPTGWQVELLVVDNGSTDHTPMVISSARLQNVTCRSVYEPTRGLGHARNRGLRDTTGKIILFTDDDVRVPLNWIEAMCHPILTENADAVAGAIIFPAEIATTLSHQPLAALRSWFASSEELNPIHPSRMIGANMAFHRRILDRVPGFDVELGAGALGSGEETLFSRQVVVAGFKLVGALDVEVEHHLDVTRLSADKLIGSACNIGRSHAYIFYHWEHQRSRLAFLQLILSQIKRLWTRCFAESAGCNGAAISLEALKAEQEYAFYREYLIQRRRRRKYTLHGLTPLATNTEV